LGSLQVLQASDLDFTFPVEEIIIRAIRALDD
jgi:hypothetical protein